MLEGLKQLFKRQPTTGGGKDSAMAEQAKDDSAKSAAQGAGSVDLAAFKKELLGEFKTFLGTAIGEAMKPYDEKLGQLGATVADLAKPKEEKKAADAPKAFTAEDAQKLIGDAFKSQQQSAEAVAKKTAARNKVMAAKGLDKLPASIVNLPDSDDEAALTTAADKLVADLNGAGVKLADVGGAKKDGGTTAAAASAPGGFLKMPGAAA